MSKLYWNILHEAFDTADELVKAAEYNAEAEDDGSIKELDESTNLRESLKNLDSQHFDLYSESYELEMLYESVKTTLSAQQKNDLAKFVRKARTAEEVNTYMTGMLAKDEANESLNIKNYDDGYVTLRDGEPNFVYNNLSDAKRGMMYDRAGDIDDGEFDHTYELRKLENGQLTALNEDVEDIDEATFNKLKEIAYELDEYIEDKVWVREFWYDGQFDNTISFEIYGDWKHDHARFKYYASEWLDNKGLKYKMWEVITDEDGSDSYGATHTIRLYDLAEKEL